MDMYKYSAGEIKYSVLLDVPVHSNFFLLLFMFEIK